MTLLKVKSMNEQQCERYLEWMSLAQDGMLSRSQNHALHAHLADCPYCQEQLEAMTAVSRMFRATPMAEPTPGFVARFEARLAYLEEQHRRAVVWFVLGIGVVALFILALPSLAGTLYLTGRLVLPYELFAYAQGLSHWIDIVFNTLAETAWVLVRYLASESSVPACLVSTSILGVAALALARLLVGRLITARVR
jgi:predicted anti-sigma-YlaC factor YlaD